MRNPMNIQSYKNMNFKPSTFLFDKGRQIYDESYITLKTFFYEFLL